MNFEAQILAQMGGLIKQMRESRGLSQHELSERTKLARETISRIEGGKMNLTIIVLGKIASALNCFLDVEMIPQEIES